MKIRLSAQALANMYPTKRKGQSVPVRQTIVPSLGATVTENDVLDVDDALGKSLIASGLMEEARSKKSTSRFDSKESE